MSQLPITITKVETKADKKAFVDLPYRLYADNPNWVPPLKMEVHALLTPGKNPWFEHGRAALFLARRGEQVVGRISAHIDDLALTQPPEQGLGPGKGFWGMFEAEDEAAACQLLAAAEDWLRGEKMTHAMGPFSLSYWDEIGLLVDGHDHPPTVMMGYNGPNYQPWVEAAGYDGVEDLFTYQLPIARGFPPLVGRLVEMGEKNSRIRVRRVDKSKFDAEAKIIITLLNEAWSGNWGFVPFTPTEITYAGEKLKPLVHEHLVRIAEVDGKPAAFMMAIPNMNERIAGFGGSLWPFNWAKLLWWLRKPKAAYMRVPLMGVASEFHGTRMASQLAMMLIEYIRRDAVPINKTSYGDFGWVLASNGPMRSVGEAVGGEVNKVYRIYQKQL